MPRGLLSGPEPITGGLLAPYMPNPHPSYDPYGTRIDPAQFTRAQGNEMAMANRQADPNRVRGALLDMLVGSGMEPGTADFWSAPGAFMPVIGDAMDAEDAYQSLRAGDYLGAGLAAISAAAPFVPAAARKMGKNKALRQRYSLALSDASGGKDPMRIKLKPEVIDKAKKSYVEMSEMRKAVRAWPDTLQMQQAKEFAERMSRQGEDIRFKMPDGPRGSIYVRVGDRGAVRFSDHMQPEGFVGTSSERQTVGGFSKALGRRHYPAPYSVSPHEMTLEDVLSVFKKDK